VFVILNSYILIVKGRLMRRILAVISGALVVATAFVLVPASASFAAVCNNSARYTMDDAVCGYIHPDDRVFAILSRINDLQQTLDSYQVLLNIAVVALVVIALCLIALLVLHAVRELDGGSDTESQKEELLADQ